jgi:hypothetical protein
MGDLTHMKIWHDNSGHGNAASWYLKHIQVYDLQTKEKFIFLCNQWLAVEKGDGKLVRELFVTSDIQMMNIKHLMSTEFENKMNEYHLWLSVFCRSVESSLTSLDRVTCCFVFHYLSMLLNIVLYEIILNKETLINFGLVSVSLEQVK